ncbi:UTP:RNA uridylyltransferase 1 [Camellia lanceoleosa]|uniref:UTP:RNA uridylyltransferase 1 n=1 Tax=Camellia lanceoleosa TaxID=1840588 RepID=A0ACC0IHS2_9ERIC|nr:UTP:RNA uridylyltransferase 1 [Camellia lanceoleosa]
MTGGGGDHPLPPQSASDNSGEFLLQLLRRPPPPPPPHHPPTPPQQPPLLSSSHTRPPPPPPPPPPNLSHDPAVAAVGPTRPFSPFPSNGHDLPFHHRPPWPHSPPLAPDNFLLQGFPQNPNPSWSPSPPQNPHFNTQVLADDIRKLGVFSSNPRPDSAHQHDQILMFGSVPCEIRSNTLASAAKIHGLSSKERELTQGNRQFNGLEANFQNSPNFSPNPMVNSHAFQNQGQERSSSGNLKLGVLPSRPPPGFPTKPSNLGNLESGNRSFDHNVDKEKISFGELSHMGLTPNHDNVREKRLLLDRKIRGRRRLSSQFDCPGPSPGSNLHSVSGSDVEESLLELHDGIGENEKKPRYRFQDDLRRCGNRVQSELDDLDEQVEGSLVREDESDDKNDQKPHQSSRDKDYRSDTRGQKLLGQRMRNLRRLIPCRHDIHILKAPFLAIYETLIPPEEEKAKQKQLLTLLEKLVSKEWPEARLHLYGSCANSFRVSKSDMDVCLAIEDPDVNKSEVLLKLADILQSDNLQNVQALTRARVPIVKLMDPVTAISCDICINNVLAVVNTKLLRDYAQIDVRLRQLALIVKHWAKSRGVNATYQGTLSSYAYVLMCIHFLQQRKPAILPCLQGMERTYAVTVDNIECAYFDQVDKLSGFGSRNRESIAQLVWAFFNYWAYCHDYANDVISIRTGSILSKRAKDWTRRIGNDRHLICIEDPFEISHDLGRVVDKNSIRVLREEFERAAQIMQFDHDPCVTLFEPYILS